MRGPLGSWFDWLLLVVPLAIVAEFSRLDPLMVFAASALGIVPLAGLLGKATEELSGRFGPGACSTPAWATSPNSSSPLRRCARDCTTS